MILEKEYKIQYKVSYGIYSMRFTVPHTKLVNEAPYNAQLITDDITPPMFFYILPLSNY